MNPKSHRWPAIARSTALSVTAMVALGISASQAWALSLGPVVVQSTLGEPLRAEIDILDINADEAASLKAGIASPEAFRAAGLDYNTALGGIRANLARRSNGRAYISLQGDKAVNDPFVDMILETTWASGRIVRDYTLLFDPPNLRAAPAPSASQSTLPISNGAAAVAAPVAASADVTRAASSNAAPKSAAAGALPSSTANKPAGDGQITVKRGDTAGMIALVTQPANVSLDQMLVALLRANPDAFVQGNINRLKSGAVLTVPSAEQAGAISGKDATQTIVAHSRDFGEFRKKLAAEAPVVSVAATDRKSGGSIQAKVEEKKQVATGPDKLKLSKATVPAQSGSTEKIAKNLSSKDAAARAAEISKNIAELDALGAASTPAKPGVPATPAQATTPVPNAPKDSASSPNPASSAAGGAQLAAVAVPSPATSAASAVVTATETKKRTGPVAGVPPPEPTLIDQLAENPMVPAAGAGLVALLAGFGWYRARQRKQANEIDSTFAESRLRPDSFFGSSGGQRVDTGATGSGSSMVYTPSQLDAADDVDPVAEADVYLAYGRDIQAEEILKDALKTNAGRIAIHQKLLEIYGKRRDARNFELAANDAYKITRGEGYEWERICEQGAAIDPSNPLYLPGGKPSVAVGIPSQPMPLEMQKSLAAAPVGLAGLATTTTPIDLGADWVAKKSPEAAATPVDLDFDLDFSLDDAATIISEVEVSPEEQTARMAAADTGSSPLETGLDTIAFDPPSVSNPGLSRSGVISRPASLDPTPQETEAFKKEAAVSFGATIAAPLGMLGIAPEHAPKSHAPIPLDLDALSLDLGDTPSVATPSVGLSQFDTPLLTKLALAEEFSSIGNAKGARSMLEEIIAEGTGDIKARAQQILAHLA